MVNVNKPERRKHWISVVGILHMAHYDIFYSPVAGFWYVHHFQFMWRTMILLACCRLFRFNSATGKRWYLTSASQYKFKDQIYRNSIFKTLSSQSLLRNRIVALRLKLTPSPPHILAKIIYTRKMRALQFTKFSILINQIHFCLWNDSRNQTKLHAFQFSGMFFYHFETIYIFE